MFHCQIPFYSLLYLQRGNSDSTNSPFSFLVSFPLINYVFGTQSQIPVSFRGRKRYWTQVKRVCPEVVFLLKNICTEGLGYVEKQLCFISDKPNMWKTWCLYAWSYPVLLCHDTVYAEFRERIDLSLNVTLSQPTVQPNQIFKWRVGKSIVSLAQWKNMEVLSQLPSASLVSYSHSDRAKISRRKKKIRKTF